MANFDINNFAIDRVVKGLALSQKDNSVLFSINQIQNPSLNCASESTDTVDAMGTPIATFYRAKSAEFSAENALFDMSLMAAQLGTTKKVASSTDKTVAPAMESFTAGAETTYTLKHTPKVEPTEVYALNGDSTFGKKYVKGTYASDTEFSYADGVITLPTGLVAGTEMFVMYEYETENAVEVVNSAKNFPTTCKFVMEILGCDVCNQEDLVYAYLIFPNFKLSPDFDWTIQTDSSHPFSGKAMQDYCDKEKKLFSIIIPGDEE